MKKYTWIVALLAALSVVFMGCPSGIPPEPPPGEKADPIDVTFTQDMLDVWGGGDIVAEADGSGFTFTYGTGGNASHGNAVAMFKVDLGTAKVRDYEKVTFTFTGISGDLGPSTGQYDKDTPKGVNLLAADDKDKMKNFGGNDDTLVTYIVNPFTGAASGATINEAGAKIGDQPAEIDLELAIGPSRPQAINTGEVWFSIYLHASAVKWAGTPLAATDEKTSFKITNVSFVPLDAVLGDVAVDIAAIAGITVPATGGTPVAAITETTQFTGAVAWKNAAGTAVGAAFEDGVVYTATITLTAKEGFTFEGVAADFFTVAGATTVTNAANSGVVTAIFPAAAESTILVINAPTPQTFGTASGNVTITGKSVHVTTSNDDGCGFYYELPANWETYETIEVTYNATITTAPAKVSVKKGANSWTDTSPASYKSIEAGTGKTFSWDTSAFTGMTTPGISFQINNGASADNTQDWTFEATKITLTP